jgi:thioredoxin-like negative regulator of GroEL
MRAAIPLLLLALAAVVAEESVVLTTTNMATLLASGAWLVKFCEPDSVACQRLAPHWTSAATVLEATSVHVGELDCAAHHVLCRAFGVHQVPTIKVIEGTMMFTYAGDGSTDSIVHFVIEGFVASAREEAPKLAEYLA